MRPRSLTIRLAIFALAGVALVSAGAALRAPYAALLLPAWTAEVRMLLPGYVVRGERITGAGADEAVRASASVLRRILNAGERGMARIQTTASTLIGHAVLHPVLVLWLLALMASGPREYLRLAVAALPWIALIEALDVPLVLAEQLRVPDPLLPGAVGSDKWTRFLDGGGRAAMCVVAACAAWWTLARFERWRGARARM